MRRPCTTRQKPHNSVRRRCCCRCSCRLARKRYLQFSIARPACREKLADPRRKTDSEFRFFTTKAFASSETSGVKPNAVVGIIGHCISNDDATPLLAGTCKRDSGGPPDTAPVRCSVEVGDKARLAAQTQCRQNWLAVRSVDGWRDLAIVGRNAVPPDEVRPVSVLTTPLVASVTPSHTDPLARTSVHGLRDPEIRSWVNVCAADHVLACPVEGTAAPPAVSPPVIGSAARHGKISAEREWRFDAAGRRQGCERRRARIVRQNHVLKAAWSVMPGPSISIM